MSPMPLCPASLWQQFVIYEVSSYGAANERRAAFVRMNAVVIIGARFGVLAYQCLSGVQENDPV